MLNSYHCVKFFVHGVRAYSLIVFPPLFLQKSSRKSSFGIVSFRRRSAQQLGALREKSLSVRLRLGLFFLYYLSRPRNGGAPTFTIDG